jgi:hypothetical protein
MALFRTISRVSFAVSAVLGAWRLWKIWRDRQQTPIVHPGGPATSEV